MRSKRITRQFKKILGAETVEGDLLELARKLKDLKTLGAAGAPSVENSLEPAAATLERLPSFFDWVEQTFEHYEKMQEIAARSLEVSSKELSERNLQVESLMNSLGEGFLIFDREGRCLSIFSKACEEILGLNPAGKPLAQVLGIRENERETFDRWITFLFEEPIDFEDLVAAGPTELPEGQARGRYVTLSFRPIRAGENRKIQQIVLVATDRTAERAARIEVEKNRDHTERLVRILRHRNLFLDFLVIFQSKIARIRELIGRGELTTQELSEIRGDFHTIKGAASSFCLTDITGLVHEHEDRILKLLHSGAAEADQTGVNEIREFCDRIEALLNGFLEANQDLLGTGIHRVEELREVSCASIQSVGVELVRASVPESVIERFSEGIASVAIGELLQKHRMALSTVARKLGKKVHPIAIDGGEIRLIPEPYRGFFESLVHLIQNAVDHGIEFPKEREEQGKDPAGRVAVHCSTVSKAGARWIHLIIEDDGRGIRPEAIRARLKEQGIEFHGTDEESLVHIFDEGFSTVAQVTDISGRGIGLGVVRREVDALGGTISVRSEPGRGTRFEFELPCLGLREVLGLSRKSARKPALKRAS